MPDSSELNLQMGSAIVELKPYGGAQTFPTPLNLNPHFQVRDKNGDEYGFGYLELTSGQKIEFEFLMLPSDAWDILKKPFALPKNAPQVGHRCSRCGFIFLIANPALSSQRQSSPVSVTCPVKTCGHIDQIKLG